MTRKKRVAEASPAQVYLGADEQRRLASLAAQLGTNKSDTLRRGLLALERELSDPSAHPALRLIGLASAETGSRSPVDAAREHDRVLADVEEASWKRVRKTVAKRRGR